MKAGDVHNSSNQDLSMVFNLEGDWPDVSDMYGSDRIPEVFFAGIDCAAQQLQPGQHEEGNVEHLKQSFSQDPPSSLAIDETRIQHEQQQVHGLTSPEVCQGMQYKQLNASNRALDSHLPTSATTSGSVTAPILQAVPASDLIAPVPDSYANQRNPGGLAQLLGSVGIADVSDYGGDQIETSNKRCINLKQETVPVMAAGHRFLTGDTNESIMQVVDTLTSSKYDSRLLKAAIAYHPNRKGSAWNASQANTNASDLSIAVTNSHPAPNVPHQVNTAVKPSAPETLLDPIELQQQQRHTTDINTHLSLGMQLRGLIHRDNHELSPPTPSYIDVNDCDQAESLSNTEYALQTPAIVAATPGVSGKSRIMANANRHSLSHNTNNTNTSNSTPSSKQKRPYPHSGSEKARRDRINDCINCLRRTVPACVQRRCEGGKCDKASILKATVEYVTNLQARNEQLETQLGNSKKRQRVDSCHGSDMVSSDGTLLLLKSEQQHQMQQIPQRLEGSYCGGTASTTSALASSPTPQILSQSTAAAAGTNASSQHLWPTRVLDNLVPDDIEKLRTAMNDEVIEVSVEASENAPQSECLLKVLCSDKRGLLRDTVNALYELNVDVVRAAANTIDSKISYDIFEIVHKGQNLDRIKNHLTWRLKSERAFRTLGSMMDMKRERAEE